MFHSGRISSGFMEAEAIIGPIMERHGARCRMEEFHSFLNLTFHEFESESYDEVHAHIMGEPPSAIQSADRRLAALLSGYAWGPAGARHRMRHRPGFGFTSQNGHRLPHPRYRPAGYLPGDAQARLPTRLPGGRRRPRVTGD